MIVTEKQMDSRKRIAQLKSRLHSAVDAMIADGRIYGEITYGEAVIALLQVAERMAVENEGE